MPWIFTQQPPHSTGNFIKAAAKRGIKVGIDNLRDLYQAGVLVPLLEITDDPVRDPEPQKQPTRMAGSLLLELYAAQHEGRLRDLGAEPYDANVRFDSGTERDGPRWHNGLIYGHWQLLTLADEPQLIQRHGQLGRERTLPPPQPTRSGEYHRRWALVLTALEARYLPVVEQDWLRLTNVDTDDWYEYREGFDPASMLATLGVTADEVRNQAETHLLKAHNIDPTGTWSTLISRAPKRAWKTLSGNVLIALDRRLAAEILLLFYEDLVSAGHARPWPELKGTFWHPLDDRISHQPEPLDQVLARLGISPHPGVVLILEGETEERLTPRVFDRLDLRDTPDLVRILCMRGSDKELALVAAATAAPLLGERRQNTYDLIRTPTKLLIAVDRDDRWDSDAKVARQTKKILDAIDLVVKSQGATIARDELEHFVTVRRWPARCFEFAHFTDAELATAMRAIHATCGNLTDSELVDRIRDVRLSRRDVKAVWDQSWHPKPSKVDMADALWPTLAAKIDAAQTNDELEVPPIVDVVYEAYHDAMHATIGSFVITATDPAPDTDS